MDPRESRTKGGISQANCLEHCLCGNYRPGEYWTQTSRRSEGTSYIIQEERINSHGKASCKAQSAWSFTPWPNPPAYLKKGTFFQGNRVADRLAAAAHSHRGCSTFTGPVSKEKKKGIRLYPIESYPFSIQHCLDFSQPTLRNSPSLSMFGWGWSLLRKPWYRHRLNWIPSFSLWSDCLTFLYLNIERNWIDACWLARYFFI